jgi:hypothetical protein
MSTIMVQISDRQWTTQAMHLACAMARNTRTDVTLLQLQPVKNPGLLGSGLGSVTASVTEYEDMHEYDMIAEDYGVALTLQPMQYESQVDALAQAAEHLNANAVFANLPSRGRNVWTRFQYWNLRRQLASQRCPLYTLDQPQPNEEWVPSVSLRSYH